jgi:DNA-binding beta-propeller fold protein YncE
MKQPRLPARRPIKGASRTVGRRTITPKVTITRELTGLPSLMGPAGITFDSAGDLWVTNSGGNTLSEFGESQLSKSGEPTPLRIVGGFNTNLNGPLGIALEP